MDKKKQQQPNTKRQYKEDDQDFTIDMPDNYNSRESRSQRYQINDSPEHNEDLESSRVAGNNSFLNQSNAHLTHNQSYNSSRSAGGFNSTRSSNQLAPQVQNGPQKKKGVISSIISRFTKIVGVGSKVSTASTGQSSAGSSRLAKVVDRKTDSEEDGDDDNGQPQDQNDDEDDDEEDEDEQEEDEEEDDGEEIKDSDDEEEEDEEEGEDEEDEDDDQEEDDDQDEDDNSPGTGKIIKSRESGPKLRSLENRNTDDDEENDEEELEEENKDDSDEDSDEDDEEDEERDEEDEDSDSENQESSEEERDPSNECIHRLPKKNQKVHLDYYNDAIQGEKEPKQPSKRGFLKTWIWGEDPAEKAECIRYFILEEGKLIVLKSLPETKRNYGEYFTTGDQDKVQMPDVYYNAQIRSVSSLQYLEKVSLLNYKEVYGNKENDSSSDDEQRDGVIKMRLDWRMEPEYGNFGPISTQIKSRLYLLEKRKLENFINLLKVELRKWKKSEVECALSKNMMQQSRTQFISGNGTGRDTYIYLNNGGFCPPTQPIKIEELGTFYYQKQRPKDSIPTIHSKGVQYINNGGGRDTYISSSSGGLRSMHAPAQFKRTFYNSLRHYEPNPCYKKVRAKTATNRDYQDKFLRSQQHFNDKFSREAHFVREYQKGMDYRLSQPKALSKSNRQNHGDEKLLRNSAYNPAPALFKREKSYARITAPLIQKPFNQQLPTQRQMNFQQFSSSGTNKERNDEKQLIASQPIPIKKDKKKDFESTSTELKTLDDHLPRSLEIQDDLQLNKPLETKQDDSLGESLTYSQEYYILHREELMARRREKEEEAKFGDFQAKLVKRPQKNFLWGYGTQVHDDTRDFFRDGELPTIRELIKFLEVYQMKDIAVVNLKATGRDTHENYAIVCSGFSIKHLYNTAKILCSEVKKLKCPQIINQPFVAGRKDDSWMLVTIKEIQVNMILNEYREDLDLEFRWLNPPPEEMVNKWKLYESLKKRSANLEVNDDTFKKYKHKDGQADNKRPQFFNSKRKDSNVAPSQQEQAKNLSVIKEQLQESLEDKGLSPDKQKVSQFNPPEAKPFVITTEMKEASLAKQRLNNTTLPQYNISDGGEFENYPEIPQKTAEKLKMRGIANLFPIQQHCFYPIYNREDLIARDLTGSGKTLAFGLPLVEYLRKNKLLGCRKIQAIVLAPTRELAIQVQNELAKLKQYDDEFRTLTVYGGVSIDDQTRELRRGIEIFVGTVGRVLDHIQRENIDFSNLKTIILDEADQMLKLGFQEDVEQIMKIIKEQCKADLQICMFSATIPRWVKDVAKGYLKPNYRIVDLAQNLKNKTAKLVAHLAINCPSHNKIAALADLLICYGGEGRTIVFTQTKADANSLILSDRIKKDIEVMHGDIAQNQREVTLKRFREGKFNVLVATDVASRGLDIPNVDLVIQVEPPNDVETYIHRSGRTARAGKEGTCITFYSKKTQNMIQEIEQQAGIKFKIIGVPQPEDVIRASSKVILKNLVNVNKDVVPFFREAAKLLIQNSNNDPEIALCKAMAYISGYYKQALNSRSLLSGQEKQLTLELRSIQPAQRWNNPVMTAVSLLKKFFPQNLTDHLKGMRARADGMGIVFDIYEDQSDRFIEISKHLRDTDSKVDFEVVKCNALPELEDEDGMSVGGGSAWRGGGNSSTSFDFQKSGQQPRHGRHQSYSYNNNGGSSSGLGAGGPGGYGQKDNQFNSGWAGGSGASRGGKQSFHSRQPSGTNQNNWSNLSSTNNNGPKSYQHSRKNSNIGGGPNGSNWDQESSTSQQDVNFEDDIDVKINYQRGVGGAGPSGPSYTQFKPQTQQQTHDQGVTSSNTSTKLFMNSIHFSVHEDDLHDFFQNHNLKVVKLNILKNEKGQSKGSGFVEFESSNDANYAMSKLNGQEFGNRPISFEIAQAPIKKPSSSYGGNRF